MNSKLIIIFILLLLFFISIKSSSNKSESSKNAKNKGKEKSKENEIMTVTKIINNSTETKAEFADILTESMKNKYIFILSNFIEERDMKVGTLAALFHYKTSTWELLRDFNRERNELMGIEDEEMDEEFQETLKSYKKEYVKLSIVYKNDANWKKQLCMFYKFYCRLKSDKKLASNDEWVAYTKHKYRHYNWIHMKTLNGDENHGEELPIDLPEIDFENEKFKYIECTDDEENNVQKYAQNSPQWERAHFWSLYWMFKNSRELQSFLTLITDMRIMKLNMLPLFGDVGLERMEYAFPDMLQIYNLNNETLLNKYTRLFLSQDRAIKDYIELDFAIRFLYLKLKNFFRNISYFGENFDENIENLWNKVELFRQHIVKNLSEIIDGFLIDDYENMRILVECICLLSKLEITNNPKNSIKTYQMFGKMNLEDLLNCDKNREEIQTNMREQLYNYHFVKIGNLLQNVEFSKIFKEERGIIYNLKMIIGGINKLELFWVNYSSYLHDEMYFKDENKLKLSYQWYFTFEDDDHIQIEKLNAEIFVLMEWIENFMRKEKLAKKCKNFLDILRCHFRNDLDMSYLSKSLQNDQIIRQMKWRITAISGKLIEFIKNDAKKLGTGQQINDKWKVKLIEIEEKEKEMKNFKRIEKNEPSIQMLHVNAMERIALKAKENVEEHKFNFWKFLSNLHLNPKGIMQIFEFIDIDHVEILLGKLKIKFNKEKFEKYTTDISKSEKRNNEKQIEIEEPFIESKDEEKSNSVIKINVGKGKSKINLKNKNKELGDIKIGNEKSESSNNNIKDENKNDDINVSSEKEEKRGRNKTRRGNNLEAKELEMKKQEKMNENLMKSLERKEKINNERDGSMSPVKSTRKSEEENINKNIDRKNQSQNQNQSNNLDRSINKSIDIWKEYTLDDLMKFDTLNMHYNEILKDTNNHEQLRLTDITVFAFEIGQRLKALEIYTKFWAENKRELEKIRQDAKNLKIDKFKDINKLERALYNLLKKIEIVLGNPINVGKDGIGDDKEKNIYEMRKQLHGLRFAWIIQNDPNWENVENKDINHILNALNLEEGTKFNEKIKIWQTIFDQIKLDHELYIERKINENGKEIFDFAKYSQQLWFDDQNKNEEELIESLIEEFKFVDVKDIELGKPIKYLWMTKYMETKERVKKLIKEWHSTAKILFTGSHLLGTMTSRSDMDTIVVTYDVQIYEYNQQAECIIEEIFDGEKKIMQRMRKCENDQLFICKLCKMSHLISAIRIPGSLELVKAFFCEDDNYESESFNKCKYKVKVDFLFATLQNEEDLEKLTQSKTQEIDEILVKLSKFDRPSYFALTGLRDNLRIIEQIPNDGKNFRIACAALKLWAKRNNIYGPKLGFLKGVHMNLLMAKIYLRYPTASVPFLIEQFFATYILWPWPMPVQLLPISEFTYEESRKLDFKGNPQDYLLWYKKEPNAEMPIISPGFFESNKASDIDRYTKSIMRTVMSEGLKQIREIRAGKMEAGKEWYDFMRGHDLAKKYEHFLVVSCFTKANAGTLGDDFCEIAALKLHDFIPTEIGKILPKEIRWYHIIEAGRREKCLINREGYSDNGNYKCDVWLVGLQPKRDKIININVDDIPKLENSMNEASKIIYEDYFKYKQRFNKKLGKQDENDLQGKLHLIINYVGINELHKWNIQLVGWEIFVK